MWGIWEHRCSDNQDNVLKVKADMHRNFAMSIKNTMGSIGSYIFGIGVHDFGRSNKFRYGLQIDLNI